MILDVAVVLMDKACQVAWSLKLLPAVGRNAIWQKQFNKRCMGNQKEAERAHAQKYKSTKSKYSSKVSLTGREKAGYYQRRWQGCRRARFVYCFVQQTRRSWPALKWKICHEGIFFHTQMLFCRRTCYSLFLHPGTKSDAVAFGSGTMKNPWCLPCFWKQFKVATDQNGCCKFQQVSSVSWPALENH